MARTPIFDASLTPPRALSARGKRIVVGVIAIGAAIPGLVFYSLGAWPVVGFMGLDVLAVWWALTVSMRDGRRRERVTLYRDSLQVQQVSAAGEEQRTELNPFFVRLVVDRDNGRVTGLRLRAGEREIVLGAFLNPAEKASFASAFGAALARARG